MREREPKEVLRDFEETTIRLARYENVQYEDWEAIREELMNIPMFMRNLPDWIMHCRSGSGLAREECRPEFGNARSARQSDGFTQSSFHAPGHGGQTRALQH